MRAIGLVFLTLGYAASAVGAAAAGQSVPASPQAPSRSAPSAVGSRSRESDHAAPAADGAHVGKPSDDQQNHRKVSGNKLPTGNSSLSKSNRFTRLSNTRERSEAKDSKNSHRLGSDKAGGAANNGLTRNETVNHAPSNRASNAARPTAPSLRACAIADLMPRSSVEREAQIPEIPRRSTARI